MAPASAAAPTLLRDPYLTDVTQSWAMVNLATNSQTPAPVVYWGPAGGDCANPPHSVGATYVTTFNTTGKQFKAQLTGLASNTAYCYRVAQAGVDLLGSAPVFTSALASGAGDPFTFAVIGDWGAGTTGEANVLTQIAAAGPSFIVTTGDNVYNSGTQAEYGDLTGGNAFAPQYWPKVGRTIPAFPTEGNHGFSGSLPYFQNWPQDMTVAACAAAGCRYQRDNYCCVGSLGSTTKSYPSAWYAFDWGNSRFYVLEGAWADSTGAYQGDFQGHFNGPVAGCAICGTELTWLTNDLASHPSVHKFAFWHYPLYSDSSSQPSDTYLTGANHLEGTLAAYGVEIVFNGHAHHYERNLPQISGSPMLTYVTGGGGDPLGSVSRRSTFDAYARAVFHYLKVSVNGSSVAVTPIDDSGNPFDVQTYDFGPPPPPSNDFSIAVSPVSLALNPGDIGSATVSTTVSSGTAEAVTLGATGLPSGASGSFDPATVTAGGASTMTVTTTTSVAPGSYSVTVVGAAASATHSAAFSLTVGHPASAPRLIQSIGASETASSTTLTASFANATAPGDLLVLEASVYAGATNQIVRITDSAGNAWTKVSAYYTAGHFSDGEMWYSANASSVTSVTATLSTAATMALQVQEFAGMAEVNPLDGSVGSSNTGTAADSGAITPSSANAIAVGFVAGHSTVQAVSFGPASYSSQPQQTSSNAGSTPVSIVSGYAVLGGVNPQNVTGTCSGPMYWAAGIAIFKA